MNVEHYLGLPSVQWILVGAGLSIIIFWGSSIKNKHWMVFGIRAIDVVNPVKWLSFIKGTVYGMFLKPHILEQVLIRQLECPECISEGKCVDCGCKMPEKTYDFDAHCSLGKWSEIERDRVKWEERKEKYKIKIGVSYG